jgi:hypothetical protein
MKVTATLLHTYMYLFYLFYKKTKGFELRTPPTSSRTDQKKKSLLETGPRFISEDKVRTIAYSKYAKNVSLLGGEG